MVSALTASGESLGSLLSAPVSMLLGVDPDELTGTTIQMTTAAKPV